MRLWKRRRTGFVSFLSCYACGHHLNSEGQSWRGEWDNMWHYECVECGEQSQFSLAYPAPVRVP